MFAEDGPIAQQHSGYEKRPQQVEMAVAVAGAFERREHLIVEAGTGVGKSFAYLLPAIDRAVHHGERVVISTRTIALQEQLIYKDIPFLHTVVGDTFSAVLVKGRTNYVGLRRLAMASKRQQQLFGEGGSRDELWRIEDWAVRTNDGSLSDLATQPAADVWSRVRSEHDNCMGRRCPHYRKCFYQRARRKAEVAQLLIVNHALFFSDLAVRQRGGSLLPDYDLVVLDEAHTVEDVASDHFGIAVAESQIAFLLNGLHRQRGGRGLLSLCKADRVVDMVEQVRATVAVFFDDLCAWHDAHGRENGRLMGPIPVENSISPAFRELALRLRALRNDVKGDDVKFALKSHIERSEELAGQVDELLEQRHEGWVYWMDVRQKPFRRVSLHAKPIDVADTLSGLLFGGDSTVVLTSATLATGSNDGFAYARSRLGLTDGDELRLGSPFDYAKQMTVHVEPSLPDPSDRQSFLPAVCDALIKHIRRSDGRALVLFTSYEMLNACARRLEDFFREEGIGLLVQGGSLARSAMLDSFREDVRSVIFGTDTFWEGIDVVGEALSCLIVVKLPFWAPNRPDIEARIELIKRSGRNPFFTFQLPAATLKFKQGVGRLIRSRTDHGRAVILDSRIVQKSYGRAFLDALPACDVVHETSDS